MNIDDPNLTAYALDELDPAERAALAEALQADPAGTEAVTALRSLAVKLRAELAQEGPMELTPERRVRLLAEARAPRLLPRARRVWIPSAIAAGLVLLLGAGLHYTGWKLGEHPAAVVEKFSEPVPQPIASEPAAPVPAAAIVEASKPATPAAQPAAAPLPAVEGRFKGDKGEVTKSMEASSAGQVAGDRVRLDLVGNESRVTLNEPVLQAPAPSPLVQTRNDRSARSTGMTLAGSGTLVPAEAGNGVSVGSLTLSGAISPTAQTAMPAKALVGGSVGPLDVSSASGYAGLEKEKKPTRERAKDHWSYGKQERSTSTLAESDAEQPNPGFAKFASEPTRYFHRGAQPTPNTEAYDELQENEFLTVQEHALSTFSIDVDTASYTNVKRMLQAHERPPKGAVRVEEMINYFKYDYPAPQGEAPCSVTMEAASCPWEPEHRLVRIGLKAREVPLEKRPAANLVFLLDVSGSMSPPNRLPLARQCLRLLTDQLGPEDRVAIAVYAGNSGTVLEPTADKTEIRQALERLAAGGSTNGAAGIQLAYQLARKSFKKGQINRVILATDGDFNVGVTSRQELLDLIAHEAKSGVFLTVLGFGYGNLKDATLQNLADRGNGNYAYINDLTEGRRVLVEQMSGTLLTVAKDVKLQLEFNPAQVSAYRLIGYEKRKLQDRDFNDDTKDAGEMGSGQTVTALYEIVPAGTRFPGPPPVDKLKYQAQPEPEVKPAAPAEKEAPASRELLTLKLRWKAPEGDKSSLLSVPLADTGAAWEKSSADFRWAAAVAGFGMLLRESPHAGIATWKSIRDLAREAKGPDALGYRQEFLSLLDDAEKL